MTSSQQSLALSQDDDEFLSPTQLCKMGAASAKKKKKQRRSQQDDDHDMPELSQRSIANDMPSMSQSSSSSSLAQWSVVQFNESNLRGSVQAICGRKVLLDVNIPDHDHISKEVGPFDGEIELSRAMMELTNELIGYNKHHQCFVNGYGFSLPDRRTVRMFLDAEFSENKEKTALLDVADLPYVMLRKWGCKKLKGDGNWYAYSQDEAGQIVWLHDYILNQRGLMLVGFRSTNTKDCRESNMEAVECAPVLAKDLIRIDADESSSSSSGIKNITYDSSGKRWKFRWKVGEKPAEKLFSDVKHGNNKDTAKAAAIAFRKEIVAEASKQQQANVDFRRTWANQHAITGELAVAHPMPFIENGFPLTVSANKLIVGPWLRGSIVQHGQKLWCARVGRAYIHRDSKEGALDALHKLNAKLSCSINAYCIKDKDRIIVLECSDDNESKAVTE